MGLHAGCAYCNYRVLDYLGIAMTSGFIPALTSTYIVIIALWIVVGGLFMKGGRGWCNFLCPIGAVENLAYRGGTRLGFTFKLRYIPEKCKSCPNCLEVCPMRAISLAGEGQWETSRGGNCSGYENCVAALAAAVASAGVAGRTAGRRRRLLIACVIVVGLALYGLLEAWKRELIPVPG